MDLRIQLLLMLLVFIMIHDLSHGHEDQLTGEPSIVRRRPSGFGRFARSSTDCKPRHYFDDETGKM